MTPADKAFTQCQDYTPNRVVAAQAMGLKYPNIGQDALETFNKTGVYPGALQDVLIVLWLCVIPNECEGPPQSPTGQWTPLRALRSPDAALEAAITWGAAQGITDTKSEAWWAAYAKYTDIMIDINASKGIPQVDDNPPDDDDDETETGDPRPNE